MNIDDAILQYITDAEGHPTAVIVPLQLWNAVLGQREDTAYLDSSPKMRQRLQDALASKQMQPLAEVRSALGI